MSSPAAGPERPVSPIVTVYRPAGEGSGGLGWLRIQQIWAHRELAWRLLTRDLASSYRESILGYLWALLPVLATTFTFAWLSSARIVTVGATQLPYPLFVLINMTIWQYFATGLSSLTTCLSATGYMITKVQFPREILLLVALGQNMVDLLIRLVLVAVALVMYRVVPHWTIVLMPLVAIPVSLLLLGWGFLLSIGNVLYRDVGRFTYLVLTFWMFLTPVLYPARIDRPLLNVANPISPFIIAAADLAAVGHLTQPVNFLIGCSVALASLIVGWLLFGLIEPYVIERI